MPSTGSKLALLDYWLGLARGTPELPTDEEIAAWIRAKGISCWGQTFTVVEGDGSVRAVAWIQHQIVSFLEWRAANG